MPSLTRLWMCLFFFLVVQTFFFFFFLPPSRSPVTHRLPFSLTSAREERQAPWQTSLQLYKLKQARRDSTVVSWEIWTMDWEPSRWLRKICIYGNIFILLIANINQLPARRGTFPSFILLWLLGLLGWVAKGVHYQTAVFHTYIQISWEGMQKVGVLLLAVLLAVAVAEEDKYRGPSEEDVIVLDADNLESTIYESDETWLLELYAPWCGHCKTLRPEWAKLATKLKGIAKVAKIDASIHRKFDSVYGLKGYPHVVLIPAGPKDQKIYYTHEGARTTDSLYDWALEKIKQNKGFLVEKLTNEDKWIENCVSLDVPLCVVTFLPKIIDSSEEERQVYLEIVRGTVNNFRDKPVSFLWAEAGDHQELQDQFSLFSGFPAVLLINPQRRVFSIMKSSFTEENFQEWLKDILNRKGGKRFGQYSKSLVFGNVAEEQPVQTPASSVEINDGDEFAQEL